VTDAGAPAGRWCDLAGPPRVLAVLGGSSPYVLGLAAAVATDPPWSPGTLRLHGRDLGMLAVVGRCATELLAAVGWQVRWSTGLSEALEGADVVLHQNRYGGLAARREDELLVTRLGLPPDETLGPAGLLTALRTVHAQRPYADAVRALAPRAAVLTMTNPLGVSTAGFAAAGVGALGLCEVPETTRLAVATALGVRDADLDGDYTGLNHRGHWHRLRTAEGDVGARVAEVLERHPDRLPWTDAQEVRRLQAVPDKYSVLLSGRGVMAPGRAEALEVLRGQVLAEAAADPTSLPPSLTRREMPWYDLVVVPALRALAGASRRLVVTRRAADGVADERQVVLDGPVLQPVAQEAPPPPVRERLARYREHERLVLAAAEHPVPARVEAALGADPTVPEHLVEPASRAVVAGLDAWLAA
jgi:6-phospho-beta-glucosidase